MSDVEYRGQEPHYEWEPTFGCTCRDRGFKLHIDAKGVAWTLPCGGCDRGREFRKYALEKRSIGAPMPKRPVEVCE